MSDRLQLVATYPTTLRREAEDIAAQLREKGEPALLDRAVQAVGALKEAREFGLLARVAEEVGRHAPQDAQIRRLYAQSLIETGHATVAVDVLDALALRLNPDDPEWGEARGLLGRANKQIFFDARDKTGAAARGALERSFGHYRAAFEQNRSANAWQGVNLVALATAARRLDVGLGDDTDPQMIARGIVDQLSGVAPERRDNWFHATLAEAALGLNDWDMAESHIRQYVLDPHTTAFNLGSLLRQFQEVWQLGQEGGERGRILIQALSARTLAMGEGRPGEPGGVVRIEPETLRQSLQALPASGQLEAILGQDGPQTYSWWQMGLQRARAVASLRRPPQGRFGTGFLLRGGDLVPSMGDELMVLTNWHVVNENGAHDAGRPDEVEVSFEAEGPEVYGVAGVVWSSPVGRHDATLLRLSRQPAIAPLPIAPALPVLDGPMKPRVYVIGHPGGRELSFSFQDNELLDHEGPTAGKPPDPSVHRLHYRTPTEKGNSGSPVFNGSNWRLIALHHAGGVNLPRLNGIADVWDANEGISIHCIREAMRTALP